MTIGLDPALSFSGLVTGAGNQLAVSAARAMAESAQAPFNPLLVQGGPGLGKTARDIVAASGANLASIGYHFGSKEALLSAAGSGRGLRAFMRRSPPHG